MSISEANALLLRSAYSGQLKNVRKAIADGADVDFMPDDTGLAALHLAVGRSHFEVLKYLIEEAGATITQDGMGRWPTLIAGECQASDEVCDYIVEREAEALGLASTDRTDDVSIDED